jgi:hypothetical protein
MWCYASCDEMYNSIFILAKCLLKIRRLNQFQFSATGFLTTWFSVMQNSRYRVLKSQFHWMFPPCAFYSCHLLVLFITAINGRYSCIAYTQSTTYQMRLICMYMYICMRECMCIYKVVQIWPGQTVTCLHTISPGHIWTTLHVCVCMYVGRWVGRYVYIYMLNSTVS